MVMGHEFSGEVVSVGPNVQNIRIGSKVTVEPLLYCGECKACKEGLTNLCVNKSFLGVFDLNGGLMEYINVPEQYVVPLEANTPILFGAMIEPLSVAYRASQQAGSILEKNVVIIGAGTIGLLTLMFVKRQRPKNVFVIDINEFRLKVAKEIGAVIINTNEDDPLEILKNVTGSMYADVTIEAVGIDTTAYQSISLLKNGGTSVWIGNSATEVHVPMQEIVTRELKIQGTNVYTSCEFRTVAHILAQEHFDLERIITKVCSLEDAIDYFAKLATGSDDLLKVIVDLNQ